jgi:hypothetical protein
MIGTLEKISNLEKEMRLEEFNKKIDQHHISKEAYMDYFLYKITNRSSSFGWI